MSIKPGGFDDPSQGWTGGWATQSFDSGAIYLACEGVVMEGPFAKRKVWRNIGLYSAKGPTWMQMGRTFVRAALNSARNIHPGDSTPQAQAARRIAGFGNLDGLEFVARFDIEKDAKGEDKNTIKSVIEPDHKDYAVIIGVAPKGNPGGTPAHLPQSLRRPTPRLRPHVLHRLPRNPSPAANPPGRSEEEAMHDRQMLGLPAYPCG